MARFFGEVGYATDTIESPENSGVFVDSINEIAYFGDVIRQARSLNNNDKVNGDISVSNSISIIADEYAIENFINIKYVKWAGVLWTVSTVEVKSPRLILNLGSVYNGPTP